ncbi:MAG: hypothetical protein ACOCTM_02795 [Bacteroidota bacterium]
MAIGNLQLANKGSLKFKPVISNGLTVQIKNSVILLFIKIFRNSETIAHACMALSNGFETFMHACMIFFKAEKTSRMLAWRFLKPRKPPACLYGVFSSRENLPHACMAFSQAEKMSRMLA